jgi:hypothetical protein
LGVALDAVKTVIDMASACWFVCVVLDSTVRVLNHCVGG